MDRDSVYFKQIEEFCGKVIQFTEHVEYEEFMRDEQLQLAVVKLIENIGEAAKRLSQDARVRHSEVDWSKAAKMRDKLVHDYMDVDLGIVYDVATHEVPLFLQQIQK